MLLRDIIEIKSKHTVKFWNCVNILGIDQCWNWARGKDKDGYGLFRIGKHTYRANRIAYRLYHGFLSNTKLICHSCDNPSCCNPYHLYQGTIKENSQDCVRSGRKPDCSAWMGFKKGHVPANTKLTTIDILYIRGSNKSNPILAKELGVTSSLISYVKRRIIWKNI